MQKLCKVNDCGFAPLYECSCGDHFCIKHLNLHSRETSSRHINKILLNKVCNESREALIKHVQDLKGPLIGNFEHSKDVHSYLNLYKYMIKILDETLIHLIKVKGIPGKIFYNPIDFFLMQPVEKVIQYMGSLNIPYKVTFDITTAADAIITHLFLYNYFINDCDKHYFLIYCKPYGCKNNLLSMLFGVCSHYLLAREFEIAIQCLLDLRHYKYLYDYRVITPKFVDLLIDSINIVIERHEIDGNSKFQQFDNLMTKYEGNSQYFYSAYSSFLNAINQEKLSRKCYKMAINSSDEFAKKSASLGLGTSHYTEGNFQKAEKYYSMCIKFCEKTNNFDKDFKLLSLAYASSAELYRRVEKYKEMGKIIRKLEKIVDKNDEFLNSGIINSLMALGLVYQLNNELDKSLAAFLRCKKIAVNSAKDAVTLITVNNRIAETYSLKGDHRAAQREIYISKSYLETELPETNSYLGANVYKFMGIIYFRWGIFKEALKYFKMAEEIYKILDGNNYSPLFTTVIHQIALTHYRIGNFDESLAYSLKVRQILKVNKQTQKSYLLNINVDIADAYVSLVDFANSDIYYKKAIKYLDCYGYLFKNEDPSALVSIFSFYFDQKQYEICEKIALKAIELLEGKEKGISLLVHFTIEAGNIYSILNKIQEAREYAYKSETMLKMNSDSIEKSIMLVSGCTLADVYIELKDLTKAESILLTCKDHAEKHMQTYHYIFIMLYMRLGIVCQIKGDFKNSKKYCKKTMSKAENDYFDYKHLRKSYIILDEIYYNQTKYEKSLACCLKLKKLYEDHYIMDLDYLEIIGKIRVTYCDMRKYKELEELALGLEEIYDENKISGKLDNLEYEWHLGLTFVNAKNYSKAKEYAVKVEGHFKSGKLDPEMGSNYLIMAATSCSAQNEYEDALFYLFKSKHAYQYADPTSVELVRLNIRIAEIYALLENYKQEYFDLILEASVICEKYHPLSILMIVLNAKLMKYYKLTKNFIQFEKYQLKCSSAVGKIQNYSIQDEFDQDAFNNLLKDI